MVVAGLGWGAFFGQGCIKTHLYLLWEKGKRMPTECLRFEDNNLLMCEFSGSVESNLWGAKSRCGQLNASYEGEKGVHMGLGGACFLRIR